MFSGSTALQAGAVFNGSLGVGTSPFTFNPGQVQVGATGINSANFSDFSDYQPTAIEWALNMSSSDNTVTPDLFTLSGGTSGAIVMPNGESITMGLATGTGTFSGNFSPVGGDAINGTVVFTTYAPDGSGGTVLNAVVTVTGNFQANSFFSALGLRSGFPGGTLDLALDVTCSPSPCITGGDPGGSVTSTRLQAQSTTPEPSTSVLAGIGLALATAIRRRGAKLA